MESPLLKALAVTGTTRAPSLPNIPTVQEAGVPGYVYVGWYGLLAPAGTPKQVVDTLRSAVVEILKMPDVLARLKEDGSEPVGSTPEEFGVFMASELTRWRQVLAGAGVKAG
jgi:tripartite-type tricarboxylate transporter receptor subunit TctC